MDPLKAPGTSWGLLARLRLVHVCEVHDIIGVQQYVLLNARINRRLMSHES